MTRSTLLIALAALLLLLSPRLAAQGADDLQFRLNGFVDTYHALRTASPNDWMSSRSRVRAEIDAFKGNTSAFVSLNAIQNSVVKDKTGVELREAFLRYADKGWELKAGRQIIIWGVADAVRITDIVSPMDYTEFLAQDYDDIRIPVNALRLKYSRNTFNIEAIWIPVPDFFILPTDTDNPWSVAGAIPVPAEFHMDNTPARRIRNSELGGRVSFFMPGVDFSFSALHTWNKMPAFAKYTAAGSDLLQVEARHRRMDMLGADLSVPLGKFVVRAEAAFYINELLDAGFGKNDNNPLARNTLNSLLGLDWYPGNEWTVMAQYSHKYIASYTDLLSSRRHTSMATLNIKKNLLLNTLALSSMGYFDLTNSGFFVRTGADYSLTDQIHLLVGYDWFHGSKGMFGMYGGNSEVWVKGRFSF